MRVLALAVAAAFAFGGCDIVLERANGGGFIEALSDEEGGKADFGFGVVCNERKGALQGGWTYHDKSAGINAHGTIGWKDGIDCKLGIEGGEDVVAFLVLPYRATPGRGTGEVKITLTDTGEVGPQKGDSLRIEFLSGPYAGYENEGVIGGGNLNVVVPE